MKVSMPYFGLFPFLQTRSECEKSQEETLFQCPTSGFFLFYDCEKLLTSTK